MAQPLVQPFWAEGKIVRTKSIRNVDIDRLRDNLSALHWAPPDRRNPMSRRSSTRVLVYSRSGDPT